MKQLSPGVERLIAGAILCGAFVVMASIFVPADSPASDDVNSHDGARRSAAPTSASANDALRENPSTDPHAGLLSLGQLEQGSYLVQIYATDAGPRYSVYETVGGRELAVLMTAQQVSRYFPDLPLDELDFSSGSQIMRADDHR